MPLPSAEAAALGLLDLAGEAGALGPALGAALAVAGYGCNKIDKIRNVDIDDLDERSKTRWNERDNGQSVRGI